jgi:uncharacterized protein (UPF0332 family)
VLDPRFHRALLTAFSQRQLGDYAVDSGLSQEDISALISDAQDFLSAASDWLEGQHRDGETTESSPDVP